jgi:hypothetical protein
MVLQGLLPERMMMMMMMMINRNFKKAMVML